MLSTFGFFGKIIKKSYIPGRNAAVYALSNMKAHI